MNVTEIYKPKWQMNSEIKIYYEYDIFKVHLPCLQTTLLRRILFLSGNVRDK